jgi:hypothetical protein
VSVADGGDPEGRRQDLRLLVRWDFCAGNHTNGGIASFVGRKSAKITHPLNGLEDCALIAKEPDLFRPARFTYRVTEPFPQPGRRAALRDPLPELRRTCRDRPFRDTSW